MASSLIRLVLGRVATSAVQFATKQGLEAATGEDFRSVGEVVIDYLRRELDLDPQDASDDQVRAAARMAFDAGDLTRSQVERAEQQTMVDFNTFMSIGLSQCGSDRETFAALVEDWNREKDEIKQMSQRELRDSYRCP